MRKLKTKIQLLAISALSLAATAAIADLPVTVSTVNLRAGNPIKWVWVGDLDGNGTLDYVVDRQGNPQKIEAYLSNGTFKWEVNFGPNSANQDGIYPGSGAIDIGHYDGVTVGDVNGDGKAEVIIKYCNGVKFGNGTTFVNSDNNKQWIGVLEGTTGKLLASCQFPTDYLSVRPLSSWFGIGNCGIVNFMENRNNDNSWNRVCCVYTMSGSTLTQKWKASGAGSTFHAMRICDVNGDGTDDIGTGGFVLNGKTGAKLYSLSGVTHGDRWHIAKMDSGRSGLQGYGIQQNNTAFLYDYYYDASNGTILWKHFSTALTDVGRGDCGDIDTRQAGYECWAFAGVYNARSNIKTSSSEPYPNMRIWWDGDKLSESLNNQNVDKWNQTTGGLGRQLSGWNSQAVGWVQNPLFYGDIWGDWREEIIDRDSASSKLIIFQTGIANGVSVSRPWSDRYYHNCLSVKGYNQSHHTSFYIGQ